MCHAYWLTIFHQIAGLTLDEKVSITTGVGWMNGRCIVRSISPPLGMSFAQLKVFYTFAIGQHTADITHPRSWLAWIMFSGAFFSSDPYLAR
jgi:hypothetical protein